MWFASCLWLSNSVTIPIPMMTTAATQSLVVSTVFIQTLVRDMAATQTQLRQLNQRTNPCQYHPPLSIGRNGHESHLATG